jgi:hypothetical protein
MLSNFLQEEGGIGNSVASDLGNISVKMYRIYDRGDFRAPYRPLEIEKDRKVHEKAKKALLTHSVKYVSTSFQEFLTMPGLAIQSPQ